MQPPPRFHRTIRSGHNLRGVAVITDTTPTEIPRPGKGQSADRRLFYNINGKGHDWGVKTQISSDLDGKVIHLSNSDPCSISDRRQFEESTLPGVLARKVLAWAHYVHCLHMLGTNKGSRQSIEYADYNQSIENLRALIENGKLPLKQVGS